MKNFSLIDFFILANTKERKVESDEKKNDPLQQEKQRRKDEDKLVDLALEWNYFDGVLPILQARQGEMVKKKHEFMKV